MTINTTLAIEYKPSVPPNLLTRLSTTYSMIESVHVSTEQALNSFAGIPELEDLVSKLRATDRQLKEMLIMQAEKGIAVNIGGEETSLVDALNDTDSSVAQVRRVTAKRLAKRLYALHHPDRGGSVGVFHTIRKAAKAGDLETLYFFRIRDGIDSYTKADVVNLQKKLDIKIALFRAKNAWKIARAFYSGNGDYIPLYSKLLEKKIYDLNMVMFGLTTPQNLGKKNE